MGITMAGSIEKLFQSKKQRSEMDKKAKDAGLPKLSAGSYSSTDIENHLKKISKGRSGVPDNNKRAK